MSYNPSFVKDAKGKYNSNAGFLSIKGGTNSYLLEDELNELQWIQNEARANLIRQITKSGCLQIGLSNNNEPGSFQELGTTSLNSFKLNDFYAVLNGYLAKIDNTENTGNLITLSDPPTLSGTLRYDFVYLEFWLSEIKQYEPIHEFGGINNIQIQYDIIDPDINLETSRRVQLRWAIRNHAGVDPTIYPKGFISDLEISNIDIKGLGDSPIPQGEFSFYKSNNDSELFVAGDGSYVSKNIFNSIDGYTYAIPLFMIKRLNSAQYDSTINADGALNYVDENSVSDRPDGKFANLIYKDLVTDLRYNSKLGEKQYDKIYVTKKELEEYQNSDIENRVAELETDMTTLINNVNDNISVSLAAKADLSYVNQNNASLTNSINTLNSNITATIEALNTTLTTRIAALETSTSNSIAGLTNDLSNLANITVANLITSVDTLRTDMQYQIDVVKMDISRLDTNMYNVNNLTTTLLNNYNDIETRLSNIESQLQNLGLDPVLTDLLTYGLNMHRNSVVTSGGTIDPVTSAVSSNGTIISVPYDTFNQYVCTSTVVAQSDGQVGDIWYEKADKSFLIKNTGNGGYELKSFDFEIDNLAVNAGTGILSGFDGTGIVINRTLANTDFVCISALESYYGENGDIYIEKGVSDFTIKNTGSAGNDFQWFIIDSTQARNISIIDVPLDGSALLENEMGTSVVTGQFGNATKFDVMIGSLIAPINPEASIGEINILKGFNTFSVLFTGRGVGTLRCLVFNEVAAT